MNISKHFPLLLLAGSIPSYAGSLKPVDPREEEVKVQIAILLDTSSSMEGLIAQTKTQLWKTINTFIGAKKRGVTPFVEVALYEYGNNALSPGENFVRQIIPLSRDLDSVSKHLFSLRTNGGNEFCGAVVDAATKGLRWDSSKDVYKAIFVAGNEPFTQGPIDPMVVCQDAYASDIVVNTIHCGDYETGISQGWKSGAALAGGEFMAINSDKQIRAIVCPQDDEIAKLNLRLNETYIPFGVRGRIGQTLQFEQDSLAEQEAVSGAQVQRAVAKATQNYSNASWDLIDATEKMDLSEVEPTSLPENMQKMTAEERVAYVEEMKTRRSELQKQILQLNKERTTFEAKERKRLAEDGEETLNEVLVQTVRKQAAGKGYTFTE